MEEEGGRGGGGAEFALCRFSAQIFDCNISCRQSDADIYRQTNCCLKEKVSKKDRQTEKKTNTLQNKIVN